MLIFAPATTNFDSAEHDDEYDSDEHALLCDRMKSRQHNRFRTKNEQSGIEKKDRAYRIHLLPAQDDGRKLTLPNPCNSTHLPTNAIAINKASSDSGGVCAGRKISKPAENEDSLICELDRLDLDFSSVSSPLELADENLKFSLARIKLN